VLNHRLSFAVVAKNLSGFSPFASVLESVRNLILNLAVCDLEIGLMLAVPAVAVEPSGMFRAQIWNLVITSETKSGTRNGTSR
jgi:hypothetical protein